MTPLQKLKAALLAGPTWQEAKPLDVLLHGIDTETCPEFFTMKCNACGAVDYIRHEPECECEPHEEECHCTPKQIQLQHEPDCPYIEAFHKVHYVKPQEES